MTITEILDAVGLKGQVLAAGAAGGLLRALTGRSLKWRERIVSPVCGALAAGYLTAAAVHYIRASYLPLPADEAATLGAVGFVIGICGMWVSDVLLEIIVRKLRGVGG